MKYDNLDSEEYIHAQTNTTHYGNDFVRKFLDQDFLGDYDIGKNSVYRTHEDTDKDTIKIIANMKVNDENTNTDRSRAEYR
jgi:hypothetical protein